MGLHLKAYRSLFINHLFCSLFSTDIFVMVAHFHCMNFLVQSTFKLFNIYFGGNFLPLSVLIIYCWHMIRHGMALET